MLRFGGKTKAKETTSDFESGKDRAVSSLSISLSKMPKAPWFIKVTLTLRLFTLFCALILGIMHIWELLVEVLPSTDVVVRCYGVLLTISVWFSEFEVQAFLRNIQALESWLLRGMYYVFIGVLGLIVLPEEDLASANVSQKGMRYSSLGLCTSGFLYFILGLLCFSKLRERHLARIRERELLATEMGTLAQQKDEIERLLAETEGKLEKL